MQVAIKGPAEIYEERKAEALRKEGEAESAARAVETALEGLVWNEFEAARRGKEVVQQQMLDQLRMRKSEYTAAELAAIREEGGGSEIFIPLPQEKCAAAAAWLCDLYLQDRPWDCEATPLPDIPPDIEEEIKAACAQEFAMMAPGMAQNPKDMQLLIESTKAQYLNKVDQWAKDRAKRNTTVVDDELTQGGYYEALRDFFDDLVGLPGGIIRGPIVRMQEKLVWGGPKGNQATLERVPVRTWNAVSPFDVYPAPGSGDLQHSHVSIRLRLQAFELREFIGAEGFRDEKIEELLIKHGTEGLQNWWYEDSERADLENRNVDSLLTQKGLYDVIEHYTFATGKMLIDFGLADQGLEESQVYNITCWCVDRGVIGARLNEHPTKQRPLVKASFRRVRGGFWGQSVVEIMAPLVRMGNAVIRSLINNIAMSAGFVTEIQADRLADNEKAKVPSPYSLIQTVQPKSGSAGPAMYVHQGQVNAGIYLQVFGWVSQMCDAAIGLPSFLSGTSSGGGAGDTSSGLAQLREMATRTFKFTVSDIDAAQTLLIDRLHTDMVLTEGEDNPDLTGDIDVIVKGTKAFGDRQAQQVRLNELVRETNNPTDIALMGPPGRAELLRAALASFDGMDLDKVIPDSAELIYKAKVAAAASVGMNVDGTPMAAPAGAGGPPGAGPRMGRATQPDGSVQGDRGAMA